MHELDSLIEAVLNENLSKGSQRVLADKKLIPDLADAIRDDARTNPHNFPAGSARSFQKAPDEEVAKWFLGELDRIEKEGYEGTVFARDGQYNDWLVRRYIAGSHNWEDIIGVMNMNLRDWTLLKNRNMLQTGHTDIPKFNSVRDVGKYMSTHYYDKLQDIRNAAALAAVKKNAKTAKIVDNDDYKIYTVFNWAGARTLGNGTQWCTANSTSDVNYKNYSNRAMLFQVFPKNPEHVDKAGKVVGKRTTGPEKYQFDAGSYSFNDIADDPADKEYIREKFPYLYTDIIKGLKSNKEQLQAAIDELSKDESLKTPETMIKHYDIDEEIKKLEKFKNSGFFTDKVRPAAKPEQDAPQNPQLGNEPQQGNPTMEEIDKDVAAMLNSLKKYDMLKESIAPVLGMHTLGEKKGDMPPWLKDKKEDGDDDKKSDSKSEKEEDKEKVDEGVDKEVLDWMKRFNKLNW